MLAELFQHTVNIGESVPKSPVKSAVKPLENFERFNTESTEPVTPDLFAAKFNEVTEELAEDYKEGTRDLIRENHPELAARLQVVDDEMVAAWRSLDFTTFEEALARWEAIHRQMIDEFGEQ